MGRVRNWEKVEEWERAGLAQERWSEWEGHAEMQIWLGRKVLELVAGAEVEKELGES